MRAPERFEVMTRLAREGPVPLVSVGEGLADRERLRIGILIPDFHRGSGGLATILALTRALGAAGHECSLWFEDPRRRAGDKTADATGRLGDYFGAVDVTVHEDFETWDGADVAVATGWETVARALLLPGCGARAYLVQDYEPDFFPASAESRWAEESYTRGLYHITAGPWLARLLRERFGAVARHFELGVDHDVYRPGAAERRQDTVLFYSRRSTPRRAVPLGLLALAELHRRRPELRIVLYGEEEPFRTSFPYRHAGVLPEDDLARLYCEATVGIALSMTNYSRASQEMMACGLPCVELDTPSVRAAFEGADAVTLVPFDPLVLANAVEQLLDDEPRRRMLDELGRALVAGRTWTSAAEQVEDALRAALRTAAMQDSAVPREPQGA
jgi:O-antigen biosynthesis protein